MTEVSSMFGQNNDHRILNGKCRFWREDDQHAFGNNEPKDIFQYLADRTGELEGSDGQKGEAIGVDKITKTEKKREGGQRQKLRVYPLLKDIERLRIQTKKKIKMCRQCYRIQR